MNGRHPSPPDAETNMTHAALSASKSSPAIPERAAYKIDEAAQLLSLSRASLYRLSRAGSIRIVKVGGRSVIPASEIARLANGEAA
jgi:excisionase family DNA binding protein